MTKFSAPPVIQFSAGSGGAWRIDTIRAISGDGLPPASHLSVSPVEDSEQSQSPIWRLRGIPSNIRYARRTELQTLDARQQGLGRPEATSAVLIPIRKSDGWWALAQDERRAIIEEDSQHFTIGLDYLPAIARQLLHARDLGEAFDFLTWFEFAPHERFRFEQLLARLRATPEWGFVEREVEIWLSQAIES